MKGQHAPTSRPAVSCRHASWPVPTHTASMIRNLMAGQSTTISSAPHTIVSSELATPPKRRWRSHAGNPACMSGGCIAVTISARTKVACAVIVASALGQPHTGVVQIHEQARDERNQKIDGHRDGDDLDRLVGLIERRAGKDRK